MNDTHSTQESSRRFGKGETLALACILLLAAVLRIWYLTQVVQAPDFEALRQDLDVQDYQARAMLSGDWRVRADVQDPEITTTPYYRPPGYPYLLAVIYFFTGGSYLAPRIFNMLLGLGAIVLMHMLARRLYSVGVGLITALLMATYWAFIYFEGEVNDPAVFVALVPCLFLACLHWAERKTLARAALIGLIFGAYALMRPNILAFGPVVALWMVFMARRRSVPKQPFLRSWAGLLCATLLVIAPVTLRNWVVSGEFVPVSTYFGENLLIGNSEYADGYTPWSPYLQKLEGTGNFSVWVYPNIVRGLGEEIGRPDLTHSEASSVFARKALTYIAGHPWETVQRTLRKAVLFWSPLEITGNKVVQYEKEHYPPLKYLPGFALVMALFVGGTAMLVRDWMKGEVLDASPGPSVNSRQVSFLVFCFILVYFATFLLFFVNARARVPILGLCLLVGAYGLYRIGQRFAARRFFSAWAWVGALLVLYLLASVQYVPYTPDRARWHYARAESFLRTGDVESAIKESNQMLYLPQSPMHYMPYRLGHWFARLDEPDMAVRMLKAALSNDPEDQDPRYREDLFFHIGVQLAKLGEEQQAREYYEKALELNPEDARVYNNLALFAEEDGDYDKALELYRTALEHAPDFALARSNLGDLLGRLGRHEQAIAEFQRAIEDEPGRAEYVYNLGVQLAAAGKAEAAIEAYESAAAMTPDPRPHNNLGLIHESRGDYEKARRCYLDALRIAPEFTLAYANLGNLLVKQGQLEEARKMYQKGLETNPEDAGLHNALGYLLARLGEDDLARAHYREALAVAPEFALAHNNFGNLLKAQGRLEEAADAYAAAIAAKPGDWLGYANLAAVRAAQGRLDDARARYDQARERAPENASIPASFGNALAKAGHLDAAVEAYRDALALDPQAVDIHCNLALVLLQQGNAGAAREHAEAALNLAPDNVTAQAVLERAAAALSGETPPRE